MKIPFYIVTGWLGSGKTTLLKKLLEQYGDKIKIAVIQNEFAPGGLDGKDLQNTGKDFKLLEINNGSVFCVCQLDNFKNTLEKIAKDYQPDIIFLEASGLADPISIAEILQAEQINNLIVLKQILTIIDAYFFEKTFNMMPRFRHQVMVADKLIINKIDLEGYNKDNIVKILKKWNPFAEIIETSYCNTNFDNFFYKENIDLTKKRFSYIKSGNRPDMGVAFLRVHEKIPHKQLINFINKIKNSSHRIKGFVQLDNGSVLAIQTVYDYVEIVEIEKYEGRSELIIFNDKYSARELHKLYKQNI